jgi:hypothetical protein
MTKPKRKTLAAAEPRQHHTLQRASDNPAVKRCIRAWNRACNRELERGKDDFDGEQAGLRAFCRAMPPLDCPDNIRDFIACIAYASLTEIMIHGNSRHLLDAAKIAQAGIRLEPKPAEKDAARTGSATAEKDLPKAVTRLISYPGGVSNAC